MTVLAATLFALATLVSGWAIGVTLHRYGPAARTLRAQRASYSDTSVLSWRQVERVSPAFAGSIRRPMRLARPAQRLEWPGVRAETESLPLAA